MLRTLSASWRDWARPGEGSYVLRRNLVAWSAEYLWAAYMHLAEAEAAFRIHTSDTELRPRGGHA